MRPRHRNSGWLRLVVCAADLVAKTGESVVEAPLQRFGVTAGGMESGLLSENLSPWVL